MTSQGTADLPALLICPDEGIARAFAAAAQAVSQLALLARIEQYPAPAEVDELVLEASELHRTYKVSRGLMARPAVLSAVSESSPEATIAGLDRSNDPEAILQCLRSGAAEFLASPFPPGEVAHAVGRMVRRNSGEIRPTAARRGRLHVFAPVKGGAGATTLANNVACRLHAEGEKRVLLVDLNLSAGVIGFLLRLRTNYSVLDALRHAGQLDEALWKSLISPYAGIDVLVSPERPEPALIEPYPVQELLDFSRSLYDHVVVDLGGVLDAMAMTAITAADETNLVCSTHMPSLFLMRRTIPVLEEMGMRRDQINVLVNRLDRRRGLSIEELEKIFRASVHSSFPEDPVAVERALREGRTVAEASELGKSVKGFVRGLLGAGVKAPSGALGALRQLWGRA